jgi:hypothetical protein
MNEFLLLALIVLYLAISYVPITEAPRDAEKTHNDERSSTGIR